MKQFLKYHLYGAYHWKWYKNPEKYKRYKDHVDRVVDWIKEKNVLDVGCGDGLITHLLKAKGIDNEAEAIKVGKRRGVDDIELGDIYNIQYKDDEFDAVFMGDVLEHLEFPEKALKEVRRVLKKHLYIAVPIEKKIIDPFHYARWTEEKLKKIVESIGFSFVEKMEPSNCLKLYIKFKKI